MTTKDHQITRSGTSARDEVYLTGFGNYLESQAIKGALVQGRNSPQKVPLGLYAEQINGSAFTTLRHSNLHTWFYRIRPSVKHGEFKFIAQHNFIGTPFDSTHTPPTQMRFDPQPYPTRKTNFIEGITTFAGNGAIDTHIGAAIHLYAINESMHTEYFYNADGELLIVLQEGGLRFKTEMGIIDAYPCEIVVIPRGIKFQVQLLNENARGYICENYGSTFRLPELGVIGANGLANPRDFLIPKAAFEDESGAFKLWVKFQGQLWSAAISHSPFDVVAWHGSYFPYKYDLTKFNTISSVSFDHPDPSIFTVLTSPSTVANVANVDFVIFPPRFMVAKDTFRPPYFHRNIMSEYMGLIKGVYDAKETGFVPGGSSLHNCMSPHGPDANAYEKAISKTLTPEYYDDVLAFMFESRQVWRLTYQAYYADYRQKDYLHCWHNLKSHFENIVV